MNTPMPDLPVVAHLKTWNSVGGTVIGRKRVDLTDDHETWLKNLFPVVEPLCKVSDAIAAIAAASAVPPGYQLVPIEPTPEMLALCAEDEGSKIINGARFITGLWPELLASAPQPSAAIASQKAAHKIKATPQGKI